MDVRVGASCSFDISSIAISDSFPSGCGCAGLEFIIVSIRTSVRGASGRCCVIGTYCSVAVASDMVAIGEVPVTSGFAIVGGCKIGPFFIQLIISVTDGITGLESERGKTKFDVFLLL